MSLNAIIEVAVHFEEFVNLALFKKGLYRVDVQVFGSTGPGASQGVPYAHFHEPARFTSTTGPWTTEIEGSDEGQEEPKVVNERQSFSTRAVNVRYNDEHFLLNDAVYFRVEKSLSRVDEPLVVRLQLCRATVDLAAEGGVTRTSKYEVAATEELTIGQASNGAHAYWPLQFDSTNLCLVGVMVHAAVVGVQFREVQVPRSPVGDAAPVATPDLKPKPKPKPRRKPAPPVPPSSKSLKQRVGGALRGASGKVKAFAQRRRSSSDPSSVLALASTASTDASDATVASASPALPPTPPSTPAETPVPSSSPSSDPYGAGTPSLVAATPPPPAGDAPTTSTEAAGTDSSGAGASGSSTGSPVVLATLRPPSLHDNLFPSVPSGTAPDLFQLSHAHALVVAPLVQSFHGLAKFIASVRRRLTEGGQPQASRFSIVPDNPFTSTPTPTTKPMGGAGSGAGRRTTPVVPSPPPHPSECPALRVPQSTYSASGEVADNKVTSVRSDACVRGPWVKGAVDGLGVAIRYASPESEESGRASGSPHSTTGGLVSFSERCSDVETAEAASVAIMSEAHVVAEQLFMLWFDLVSLLAPNVGVLGEVMQAEWRSHMLAACTTAIVPRYRPSSLLDGPFSGEEDAAMLSLRADAQADIVAGMEAIGVTNHRALDPSSRPILLAESFATGSDTAAGFSDSEDSSSSSSTTSSSRTPTPDAVGRSDDGVDSDDSGGAVVDDSLPSIPRSSTGSASFHATSVASKGVHVIVFQNGLNGFRYDLRLLQSFVKLLFPYHLTLGATSNQASKTEGDIMLMGKRLAEEVHTFVTDNVIAEGLHLRSLSFVGFSLGGVIIRTALRHAAMQQYLPYLKSFITLASPHLGLLYASSALFSTGVYVMRKLKKQLSLTQLACTDAARATDRVLYRLAVGWKPMTATADPSASSGTPTGAGRSIDETVPVIDPDAPDASTGPGDGDHGDMPAAGDLGSDGDAFVDTLAVPEVEESMATTPPPLARSGSGKDDWDIGGALSRQSVFAGANGGAGTEAMSVHTPNDTIYSADFMEESAEDAAPSPSALKRPSKLDKLTKRLGRGRRSSSKSSGASKGGGGNTSGDLAGRRWRKHMLQSTGTAFRSNSKSASGPVVTEWLANPSPDKKTADLVRTFNWDSNGQILRHFKHIMLVGSAQDRYTPHHSHRAEVCTAATKDAGDQSTAFHHMVHGFWKDVDPARVTKLEVFFPKMGSKLSVDSVLGREAHLAFLESSQLAHILVLCYTELFA